MKDFLARLSPEDRRAVQEYRWNLTHGTLSKMPRNIPMTWKGFAAVVGPEVVERILGGKPKR